MVNKIGFLICVTILLPIPIWGGSEPERLPDRSIFPFNLEYVALSPQNQGSDKHQTNRSIARAIGMSFLVPGTAQLLQSKNRSARIKGITFLAIEVTSWILYAHFTARGNHKEKKFESYAKSHWDPDKYLDFLETTLNLPTGDLGTYGDLDVIKLRAAEQAWFEQTSVAPHNLPSTRTQQYYEMIYKYQNQFAQGWDDADPGLIQPDGRSGYTRNNLTPHARAYREIRDDSNRFLSYAGHAVSALLINRFLSAFDAVWHIRRQSTRRQDMELSFGVQPWLNNRGAMIIPQLSLKF